MKHKFLLVILSFTSLNAKLLHVQVGSKAAQKTKLALVSLGKSTALDQAIHVIKDDLEFTHQFDVEVIKQGTVGSKKAIRDLHAKGYPVALFISEKPEERFSEVRVYNTRKAKMIKGYKIPYVATLPRSWGHTIADACLPVLTGKDGFFSSKLAFYKEEGAKKQICVADYNGKVTRPLVQIKTTAVAPRWNNDPENPLVLYSVYTPLNVELMTTDLQGNKRVAVSFDGLNMEPAFSEDGNEVVMCLSQNENTQIYSYSYNKKSGKPTYTQLTHNDGNNISPTLMENGDVIFCSDYQNGKPQIYRLKRRRGVLKRLSSGGACYNPSYSSAVQKVAYSQMVEGTAQIMVYDFKTKQEQQVTFGHGHKIECSWSPCGNYLAFSYESGKNKRIAVHSLLTGKRRYLTSVNQRCSYPSWSINYSRFPHKA